jgi:DNA invertase Pin-like site-specific DNA recombinase
VTPAKETEQPTFFTSASQNVSPVRKQRRPGPDKPRHALPRDQWPEVVRRVEQGESLRHIAALFNVSHETVRRIFLKHQQQQKGGE